MNRREFTRSLVAAATLPALPVSAATSAQSVAARPIDIMWGEAIARAQNNGTVSHLAKTLKVPTAVAEAVQKDLLSRNIIQMGVSPGSVEAVKPVFANNSFTQTAKKVGERLVDLEEKLETVLEDRSVPEIQPMSHGSAEESSDDPKVDC